MPDLVNNSQDEKMKFLQGLILLAQEEGHHYGEGTKNPGLGGIGREGDINNYLEDQQKLFT